MEEALSVRNPSLEKEVAFAGSYLQGNAKLWFININEKGGRPANRFDMKSLFSVALGPANDKERSRMHLLSAKQEGPLEVYISNFSSLALMTPDLDEHTKAIIFTKGLVSNLQKKVIRRHPESLQDAVHAA